ncbi:MAG: VOC family protein [Planctomycetia bacterium]|nr:VOC family protein [Planctomycetia bacterium]
MTEPYCSQVRSLYMVELVVADWPASIMWYRDLFGRAPALTDVGGQFALFEIGGNRLALKAGAPQPGNSLIVFEVADLPGLLARLAAQQVISEELIEASPEGYRRAVVRDLDGHRLCLFEWQR